MSEYTKQLADAVAVPRTAYVTRCAVRGSDSERGLGVYETLKIRVLAQTSENAPASVGDEKLERAIAGAVCDQSAGRAATVLEDIVLQFAKRTHQADGQTPSQASSHGSVLRMLHPLIPEQVVRSVRRRIEPAQRKNAGAIPCTSTADGTVDQCLFDLSEDRWLDGYATIGVSHRHTSDGEFNKRPDKAGTAERKRRQLRQAPGGGLPQQVVRCLEGRAGAALLPLAQSRSNPFPARQPVNSGSRCAFMAGGRTWV